MNSFICLLGIGCVCWGIVDSPMNYVPMLLGVLLLLWAWMVWLSDWQGSEISDDDGAL